MPDISCTWPAFCLSSVRIGSRRPRADVHTVLLATLRSYRWNAGSVVLDRPDSWLSAAEKLRASALLCRPGAVSFLFGLSAGAERRDLLSDSTPGVAFLCCDARRGGLGIPPSAHRARARGVRAGDRGRSSAEMVRLAGLVGIPARPVFRNPGLSTAA